MSTDSSDPERKPPAAAEPTANTGGDEREPEAPDEDLEDDEEEDEDGFGTRLVERFPALATLGFGKPRKQIPIVLQMTQSECGSSCLSMVLGYFGRPTRIEEIRGVMPQDPAGVNAKQILETAKYFQLRGRGVRLELEDIDEFELLETGAILHWDFAHFVVFDRLVEGGIEIVDPAMGRRFVPADEVRRCFTGVAILLEPSTDFEPTDEATLGHRGRIYLKKMTRDKRPLVRIAVTSVMLQVFALGGPVLTGAIVDRVVPRGDLHLLAVIGVALTAVVLFTFLGVLVRGHLLLFLRTQLDIGLSLEFLDHMIKLPFAFFQTRSTGDLVARLNSNVYIRDALTSAALSAILDGTMAVLFLVMLLVISPLMGAICVLLALVMVGVVLVSYSSRTVLLRDELDRSVKTQSYGYEVISGIQTLKSMGSEDRAVQRWSGLYVDSLNASLARGRLDSWTESFTSAFRLGSPLLIISVGASQVLSGKFTLGTMLALNSLALGFLQPMHFLVATALQLQSIQQYIDRLGDVLDAKPEQDRRKALLPRKLAGEIAVEKVSFRYGALTSNVLNEVSLHIRPGQFVAVVGRSGSGKSTLANLLLGLYKPNQGRVLYDGVDLQELNLQAVREMIGVVSQQPFLFNATVRFNIQGGLDDLPLEAVIAAAKKAMVHEEVLAMPMGYDTMLSEGGSSISGGQRQRLALARALARNPSILLLDEATSALDGATERSFQEQLDLISCTRVVIAHRLSTIIKADLILMMDGGRVIESGSHHSLVAAGGAYARLVAAQL